MRNSATAGLQKASIMQKYPNKAILNNTTAHSLVNGNSSIEVFPPAVFFKGKQFNTSLTIFVRYWAKPELRSDGYSAKHYQEGPQNKIHTAQIFKLQMWVWKSRHYRCRSLNEGQHPIWDYCSRWLWRCHWNHDWRWHKPLSSSFTCLLTRPRYSVWTYGQFQIYPCRLRANWKSSLQKWR